MTQPTFESLELQIELFGWQVIDFRENLGPLPGSSGRANIAGVWEIASRWSPPDARMCILFVETGGRITALEAAVIVGSGTIVRLDDAEVLAIRPGGPDDSEFEQFAANLGRYRGQPAGRPADTGRRRIA